MGLTPSNLILQQVGLSLRRVKQKVLAWGLTQNQNFTWLKLNMKWNIQAEIGSGSEGSVVYQLSLAQNKIRVDLGLGSKKDFLT